MLHIVAYDIASNRRLRRVASICEDFGVRVEKSVFECDLSQEEFERFWDRLRQVVSDGDRVVDYPVSQLQRDKIRTLGASRREEQSGMVVLWPEPRIPQVGCRGCNDLRQF